MRSGYELDVYFASKRFRKRLDFFRELGEGYDFAGALFIVNQFELMQYHYGVIRHYIQTGKYDSSKENRHQIEIIDYTNRQVVGLKKLSERAFEELGMKEPEYGVHLVLPPGIRQKDIIEFVSNKENYKALKDTLSQAYKKDPGNKHAFRPSRKIDTHLEIVDKIDAQGGSNPRLVLDLSVEHGVDERDIGRLYDRLGSHKNPYLNPV
jgi:hypothetical protein